MATPSSLIDTLTRLGFSAEPSRYYGLHCLYDADGIRLGDFDAQACWDYLRQHGWIGDAA